MFTGYFELHFESWSPNGKFILFSESSDQNKGRKFLLNLETQELSEKTGHIDFLNRKHI